MDEKIRNSIERVAECADAIDRLSESLHTYTEAYSGLLNTMDAFRKEEEQSVSIIQETVPQLQQHVDTVIKAQSEFDGHLDRLKEAMAQKQPLFERMEQLMQRTEQQLQATISKLEQNDHMWADIGQSLDSIEKKLEAAPQLAEASARIQRALGAVTDPVQLEDISQKLVRQIAEIQQEKQEIIAPLKNAAAFKEAVHQETEAQTDHLSMKLDGIKSDMTEQLTTLTADNPESISGKLDLLLSVSEELRDKLDSLSAAHGKSGGLRGIFGFNSKDNT